MLCLRFLLVLCTDNDTNNNKLVTQLCTVVILKNFEYLTAAAVNLWYITDLILCRSSLPWLFQLSVIEHDSETFFGHTQVLRILHQRFSRCWTTTTGVKLYSSSKMKTLSTRLQIVYVVCTIYMHSPIYCLELIWLTFTSWSKRDA